MIIHTDTENPKPIEQKVHDLILQQLYIKVDDAKLFVDKEDFIASLLKDLIAIAKAEYNLEKALKIALKDQPEYKAIPEVKMTQLQEAAEEFGIEADAYYQYLEAKKEGNDDQKIYDQVSMILSFDYDLLIKKLHELMIEALSFKLSEADAAARGHDRYSMLDVFANQVKIIATNETMDDAVEEAYFEYENYPLKHEVKKESIRKEYERFAPLAHDEITTFKLALSLHDQNAQIPMILAMVKQMLHLN